MSRDSFPKKYLNFSRSERYGITGLCCAVAAAIAVKLFLPLLIKLDIPDTTAYEKEIALFRQAADSIQSTQNCTEPTENLQRSADLFYFDPNSVTDTDWQRLGLNDRQIRNIRNYLAKGGRFKKKEDVRKLYTISDPQYKLLEPYIRIASEKITTEKQPETEFTKKPANAVNVSAKEIVRMELNTADSAELTRLAGIGPVLAARIVKYRNRIGGFAEVTQLGEVYGIKAELIEKLLPQLSADKSLIRKISFNTATFKDLVSHPYLNEQQTKGILNYKKLQGRIGNMDELVRNNILTREDADKMETYASFEE